MDANNTSFFNETIEDESITLSDNELNNILEDSTDLSEHSSFINEEPDVIVVDKSSVNEQEQAVVTDSIEIDKQNLNEDISSEQVNIEETTNEDVSINDVEFEEMVGVAEETLPNIDDTGVEALPEQAQTLEVEQVEEALPEQASTLEVEQVEEVSLDEALPEQASTPEVEQVEEVSLEEALPEQAQTPEVEQVEEVSLDEALPEQAQTPEVEQVEEVSLDEALSEQAQTPEVEQVEEVSLDEALPEQAQTPEVEQSSLSEPIYNDEDKESTTLDIEEETSSFFDEDEDESITLNTDELNNILEDVKTEVASAPEKEIQTEEVSTPINPITDVLSEDVLKEIFVYLDNLLEKLPDEEIKKFAESHYYDLYNQIFEKLNLI